MAYRRYLFGTNADDFIDVRDSSYSYQVIAGRGDDYVATGSGDDAVFGQNGDDYLVDGAGTDIIDGGQDNDWIYAGAGDDTYIGGEGIDTISFIHAKAGVRASLETGTSKALSFFGDNAQVGNDILDGFETIYGSGYGDVLTGDAGDNGLYGYNGADTLIGGAGNDRMVGGNGNDRLYAGTGNDTYDGGAGDDWLMMDAVKHGVELDFGAGTLVSKAGATGDDDIGSNRVISIDKAYLTQGDDWVDASGSAKQVLYLHKGDDTVIAGAGDTYYGQQGIDTLDFSEMDRVTVNISNGGPSGSAGDIRFSGFEKFIGSDGDDTFSSNNWGEDVTIDAGRGTDAVNLTGTDGIVSLGDGHDSLNVLAADVTATGGDGEDNFSLGGASGTVSGGDDNDSFLAFQFGADRRLTLDGGAGWDDLEIRSYSSQKFTIDMRSGIVTEHDESGSFEAMRFSGIEEIRGDSADELIHGTDAGNIINAEAGNNTVFGHGGDDILISSNHDDILDGGAGNDHITADAGNDLLTGGSGQDTFHFINRSIGFDRITDFDASGAASGGDLLAFDVTLHLVDGTAVSRAQDLDTNLDGKIDARDTGFAQDGNTLVMNLSEGTLRLDGVDTLFYDSFII